MKIRILRQDGPSEKPYWQEFLYEKEENQTIAGMLDALNYNDDIIDTSGRPARRIQWQCSCLQGMCGACAMVINGTPALACETFLKDLRGNTISLQPLKKFPVITDLIVDRGVIQENLMKANSYIEEYKGADEETNEHMHLAGKCLKCGLCLEVCPNYKNGKHFFGAAFANDSYLISERSSIQADAARENYARHFEKGCSKALSCVKICPMKIPTLASIAKMNRFCRKPQRSSLRKRWR